MRNTPHFMVESVSEIKRLIRRNPWASIVSQTARGLSASHYPLILEESGPQEMVLLGHVGRPDDEALELGEHEILVIIQGPHGYISPSWYPPGSFVPTWNHASAHLWGVPEILDEDENLAVLDCLVNLFEKRLPEPRSLAINPELASRIARGTVGFRLPVSRWDARQKFSQNKPSEVSSEIIDQLEREGPYQNVHLAREMRRYFAKLSEGAN